MGFNIPMILQTPCNWFLYYNKILQALYPLSELWFLGHPLPNISIFNILGKTYELLFYITHVFLGHPVIEFLIILFLDTLNLSSIYYVSWYTLYLRFILVWLDIRQPPVLSCLLRHLVSVFYILMFIGTSCTWVL